MSKRWKYQNIKLCARQMRTILKELPKPTLIEMAKVHGVSVRGSKAAIVDRFPSKVVYDVLQSKRDLSDAVLEYLKGDPKSRQRRVRVGRRRRPPSH